MAPSETVSSFDEMKISPKDYGKILQGSTPISAEIVRKQVSQQDGTVKYLFRLSDGELIEGVLMKYHHGYSMLHIITVGCKWAARSAQQEKAVFPQLVARRDFITGSVGADGCGSADFNLVLMGMGSHWIILRMFCVFWN